MDVLIIDLTVLSKKISSCRTPKDQIRTLPDELLGKSLQHGSNGQARLMIKICLCHPNY